MPKYSLTIASSAEKEMDWLDEKLVGRIKTAIEGLPTNPRSGGAKKLKGKRDYWRIRVGDYRIIYIVNDKAAIIDVVRVGHRREIYD